jgi:hypothetical protein
VPITHHLSSIVDALARLAESAMDAIVNTPRPRSLLFRWLLLDDLDEVPYHRSVAWSSSATVGRGVSSRIQLRW